jgi:hypothetical protein
MFREQEHRQERIGVGMTLWPRGPTRGEEANEIEIGTRSNGRKALRLMSGKLRLRQSARFTKKR